MLSSLDFWVIGLYLVISIGLGLWFMRRGTSNSEAFFAASGAMPWWIAGSSLLVACFAADTPLWIGEIIYRRGLEGAWLYWAPAIGTAFFIMLIAPLWKRSGVLTDIEFLELRYSGRAAAVMRCLNSALYAVFASIMWMGLQTLSMVTILGSITSLSKWQCVAVTSVFAASYSIVSGLWGVAGTGAFQLLVTYVGSVVLAVYSVVYLTGGVENLVSQVHEMSASWPQGAELRIFPTGSAYGLPMMTLLAWFFFRWIEQAGMGQYVAQRLIATKNPRHAVYAAMIWGIGFFAIVPLPWIVTVVAAKVVLPEVALGQEAYPKMAMLLPSGYRGLLIASMLAAFMSTYSSLMTWGASYAVNDFYRRFLVRNASEQHYVRAGQLYMIPMAVIAAGLAIYAESLLNVIFVVLAVMSGYWTVAFVRWIWWRVNAWAEVAALGGSVVLSILTAVLPATSHWWAPNTMENYLGHRTIFIMVGTLVIWLIVCVLTPASEDAVLDNFYRRLRPPGFWGPIRRRLGLRPEYSMATIFGCWGLMLAAIFAPLLGFVTLSFGDSALGATLCAIGFAAIFLAVRKAQRMYPDETPVGSSESSAVLSVESLAGTSSSVP